MSDKLRASFIVLILLQALHSVEEYSFKFYEAFPPMMRLYQDAPELAKPAFMISNVLLVTAGLICFFRWVQPDKQGARVVVWIWVGIEACNVVAHTIWAISIRGYNPGLVTSFGFVPATAYLIYLLRCARSVAA